MIIWMSRVTTVRTCPNKRSHGHQTLHPSVSHIWQADCSMRNVWRWLVRAYHGMPVRLSRKYLNIFVEIYIEDRRCALVRCCGSSSTRWFHLMPGLWNENIPMSLESTSSLTVLKSISWTTKYIIFHGGRVYWPLRFLTHQCASTERGWWKVQVLERVSDREAWPKKWSAQCRLELWAITRAHPSLCSSVWPSDDLLRTWT